ncbi:hypothetical protein EV191_103341 [Tamaricihabitans halophyticus]|uniref:Uncharacterized protein n=1 Tax=Tamaricihabitans halophyticus TaxID=1262583 RepID=A0A4V2SUD8_9PSEU|nr:hypothetical protein [Tamaricihabitans halophyticus]TCP54296.1 hypothetical protein EV191_103341 [Tamaricihabitans halophyticus]
MSESSEAVYGPPTDQLGPSLPGSAQASLGQAASGVRETKEHAESGDLYLDTERGRKLLFDLTQLRARVTQLTKDSGVLDSPLDLGDNWVGQVMNHKLRGKANGEEASFQQVIAEFDKVLDDLRLTVKYAAGLYEEIDDDTARKLRSSLADLGVPAHNLPGRGVEEAR